MLTVVVIVYLTSCGKKNEDSRGTTTNLNIPDETEVSAISSQEETVVATTNGSVTAPADLINGGELLVSAVDVGPFEPFEGAELGSKAYHIVAKGPEGQLLRLASNIDIQLKLYLGDDEYPEDQWMLEICNVDGFASSTAVVNVPGQFKWTSKKSGLMSLDYSTRCPDLWLQPIVVSDSEKVFSVYPIHIQDKKQLGLGGAHGCAISKGERQGINCWGANIYSQAGEAASVMSEPALHFSEVLKETLAPLSIGIGQNHGCTVVTSGNVYCWGSDEQGQLGNGAFIIGNYHVVNEIDQSTLGFNVRFVAIASGSFFSCAIRSDSKIYCWGDNEFGQIGDGTTNGRPFPYQVQWPENALGRPAKIAAGSSHACVVTDHDQLYCWGNNDHGQVAPGSTDPYISSPYLVESQIPVGGMSRLYLALSSSVSCVGNEVGDIGCFGESDFGLLTGKSSASFKVASIQSMSAGPNHICTVDKLGKTSCWGSNSEGQAAETAECSATQPCAERPLLLGSMSEVSEIASGGATDGLGRRLDFSCGIKESLLICYGNNRTSQLGASEKGEDGYTRIILN